MPKVNESIINCAIYEDSTEFYGMAEVTLPEVSQKAESLTGAGIAGDVESVIIGHIEAMSTSLSFRTITSNVVALQEPRDHKIEVRVAQQSKDTTNGKMIVESIKHVMMLRPKKFTPGKVAPASPAEAGGEFSVSYFATYIDGKKTFEVDPLNFVFFVNGKDYLADVRKALGK